VCDNGVYHASVYLDDVEVVYARSIILNLCSQRYTYTVVHEGHTSTYKKVVLQLYMVTRYVPVRCYGHEINITVIQDSN
jgi:hypothetical protein